MTDSELMQMALNVMEAAIKAGDWKVDGACDPDWVLNALRAALAQPERKWQGLTLDEIFDSTHGFTRIQKDDWVATDTDIAEFAHIIEARLKAKNT